MKKVAVFDIDGTVFRSSVLVELVEELIRRGVFPSKAHAQYERAYLSWLNREGEYQEYIEAVVKTFERYIRGVPYGVLADVGKEVTEERGKRLYRFTRDFLKELKKKGYFLLAISQSPKLVLDPLCKKLGFDKTYGRIYEIGPEDTFTGGIADLHLIANKANIVKRAVLKEKLTLKGSIGVGDTEGDIPMLDLVERPMCFNPNKKLYAYARRMGWEVIVERKDVIYKL